MKRILFLLFLLLLPAALRAQAIGQVHFGDRVFSTGLPARIPESYFEDGGPKMTKERREIALRCVERTFGKVKEYQEYWGECTSEHILVVTLESGDNISFDDGRLGSYTIVSSRFTVGADVLNGGLKVGQKLNLKKSRGDWVIRKHEKKDNVYEFGPMWWDGGAYFEVDENNVITKITTWTNDC
jgi:hypothetical protein